jgi:hypothetical protein
MGSVTILPPDSLDEENGNCKRWSHPLSRRSPGAFYRFFVSALSGLLLAFAPALCAQSAQQAPHAGASTEDLQKATQNPVASLISVPFQDNTDINIGTYSRNKNTLNIQPVIPTRVSEKWNLINRIITPVIYQPEISQPHLGTFGLGDMQPTFFFSPSKPAKLIWGVGPALLLPTATDDNLGTGKWSAGPGLVALIQPPKWTIGVLVNNLWSFAGPSSRADVNTMTLQYFVNYNLQKGWYLSSDPILSANWNAPSGNVWLVPFGGGIGRIFKAGAQPMNGKISFFGNAVRPDILASPTWQMRVQLALLFPRMPNK